MRFAWRDHPKHRLVWLSDNRPWLDDEGYMICRNTPEGSFLEASMCIEWFGEDVPVRPDYLEIPVNSAKIKQKWYRSVL